MTATLFATSVAVLCWVGTTSSNAPHPLSDEFIDLINGVQTTWQAGRNFHPDTPMSYLKNLVGLVETDINTIPTSILYESGLIASLPEKFDSRDKWPHCPSLNEIRDQADCGSCWAFAAVEAMTDRICIHSNGTKQFHVSAFDAVSCGVEDGCHGSSIDSAWKYWKNEGIVSGGNYSSHEGCKPYPISPCDHRQVTDGRIRQCGFDEVNTPPCQSSCEHNYNVTYENDKVRGTLKYFIGEDQMRAELFHNGPIGCGYRVYHDFLSYKNGVYTHTKGKLLGGHAVKIIGWGIENGVKYWLCANSWNEDWGQKGFFKILRGEDHVSIETVCVAGEPIF